MPRILSSEVVKKKMSISVFQDGSSAVSFGSASGDSEPRVRRACTPRSPILLSVIPPSSGTASLICRKTWSIEKKRVAAGKRCQQIAQNFPVVPRVARAADGAVEPLQTTFAVDHRAAFFGIRKSGEHGCRFLGSCVLQKIDNDEGGQIRQVFGSDPDRDWIFVQREEGFDTPVFHRLRDLRQFRARLGSDSEQTRAVAVRVAVFAEQNVVAGSGVRHNVDQTDAERSRQLCGEPELL